MTSYTKRDHVDRLTETMLLDPPVEALEEWIERNPTVPHSVYVLLISAHMRELVAIADELLRFEPAKSSPATIEEAATFVGVSAAKLRGMVATAPPSLEGAPVDLSPPAGRRRHWRWAPGDFDIWWRAFQSWDAERRRERAAPRAGRPKAQHNKSRRLQAGSPVDWDRARQELLRGSE